MTFKINVQLNHDFKEILNDECIKFIEELNLNFNKKRIELLENRKLIQKKIDEGWTPIFLKDTKHIRNDNWKIKNI